MRHLVDNLTIKIIVVLVLAVTTIRCSGDTSYEEALNKNEDRFEDVKQLEDANFLVEAMSLNMLGVTLCNLASDSGYSSIVVNLARQNAEDHKNMDEDIRDIAKKKNVTLPAQMSEAHNNFLNELTSSRREDFDITFTRIIKNINEQNSALYTSKATEAFDPDVRAFATRKLDILRSHTARIANIEKQLLETSQQKGL